MTFQTTFKKTVLTLGHIFSKRQLFKQQTLAFSDRAMGPLLIIKFKSLVSGVVFLKNETENPKKRKILQILKIFGHDMQSSDAFYSIIIDSS